MSIFKVGIFRVRALPIRNLAEKESECSHVCLYEIHVFTSIKITHTQKHYRSLKKFPRNVANTKLWMNLSYQSQFVFMIIFVYIYSYLLKSDLSRYSKFTIEKAPHQTSIFDTTCCEVLEKLLSNKTLRLSILEMGIHSFKKYFR